MDKKFYIMSYLFKNLTVGIIVISLLSLTQICRAQNDSVVNEVNGTMISRDGTTLMMKLDKNSAIFPQLNIVGKLMAGYSMGPAEITNGWLTIAKVKNTGITGDEMKMFLIKDLNMARTNGTTRDYFVAGQQVKFTWMQAAGQDKALYNEAMLQYASDPVQAEIKFKKAVAINPQNAAAFNMIATIKEDKNAFDSATYYYRKAYFADSSNLQYLKNLALSNIHTRNFEEAYSLGVKSVVKDPKDAYCYYLRGFSYLYIHKSTLNENDKKIVLDDLAKSISIEPQNTFYLKERMYIRNMFSDVTGACDDAKKYSELGGENAADYIKKYCQQ
jgi:Tfp pilus assembly protein PilF